MCVFCSHARLHVAAEAAADGGGHACGRHIGRRAQYGRTVLMYAAGEGREDCARLLLDAGADKNATNKVRASVGVGGGRCGVLGEVEID